jgi:hypothetical protein
VLGPSCRFLSTEEE